MTKKIPSIKSSAQARLILYKLFNDKLTQNQKRFLDSHPGEWEKILTELESGLELGLSENAILARAFAFIERISEEGLQSQIKILTGQNLWLGIKSGDLLERFLKEHISLIKSFQREQLEKIGLALNRGIRQGLLPKDIALEIKQVTRLGKKRANLIARAAPLQYSGSLTRHNQISAGIKKYRWQTSQDERVRESHKDKNGQIYSWDSSGPHPRSEINCRCDAVPVLETF